MDMIINGYLQQECESWKVFLFKLNSNQSLTSYVKWFMHVVCMYHNMLFTAYFRCDTRRWKKQRKCGLKRLDKGKENESRDIMYPW